MEQRLTTVPSCYYRAVREILVCVAMLAAAGVPAGAQSQGQEAADDRPLAQVGDRRFTSREVDAEWKAEAPTDHAQAMERLYDGRRAALDRLLADALMERAALRKGISRQRFESEETAARARPVTDAQIAEFYRDNRNQMEGRPLAEIQGLLRELLEEREQSVARASLVAALKIAEPDFIDLLEPPRRQIELSADDPVLGPASAPVTIVELADFQCPYCRDMVSTLRDLRARYGDRIRLVWKDLPLARLHPQAVQSAEAARCAHEQGKFWEYHDVLFANQRALQLQSLKQHAINLGLDVPRFAACVDSSKYGKQVRDAVGVATRLGLSSTPSLLINGRLISGVQPVETLAAVVEDELRRASRP